MLESPMTSPQQIGRAPAATVADAMISIPKVSDTATSARDLGALFDDDHIHAALVVDGAGVLITVIERADLRADHAEDGSAMTLGTLQGRIVSAWTPLAEAWQLMLTSDRRRLAVVDPDGRLLGLLCLKRTGAGFCSDQDVRARLTDADAITCTGLGQAPG